jgi:hypothetical protein
MPCLIKYVFRCLYIEDYNRFMFLTEIKNVGKRKLALMYNIRNVIGPLDTDCWPYLPYFRLQIGTCRSDRINKQISSLCLAF